MVTMTIKPWNRNECTGKLYIELTLIGNSMLTVSDFYPKLYDEVFKMVDRLDVNAFIAIYTDKYVEMKPRE